MIDIGVNLTSSRFDKDRNEVIERAKSTNVQSLIVTGTNVIESQRAAALCLEHQGYMYSTAGVHPHDADHVNDNYLDEITVLSELDSVKAIGECGLDFNRNFSAPKQQQRIFSEQVLLAHKLNMPLFLHQRDAFDAWFDILKPYIGKIPAMVAHCFTGSKQELKQCLDAGMYIGITGWVCDERRGQALRDIVKYIPLKQLMIETDAPYLIPRSMRPKPKSSRNEPSYLPHIIEELSSILGCGAQELITQTSLNAKCVFELP